MTRKEFLQRVGFLFVGTVGAGSLLSSCGGGEEKPAQTGQPAKTEKDPCSDLSGLTDAEKQVRTTFEYVAETNIEGKRCDNCQFWIKPTGDAYCGGCQIIKGPINPKGYCNQWVAMQTQG